MYDHLISASLSVSGGHSSDTHTKSVSIVVGIKNERKYHLASSHKSILFKRETVLHYAVVKGELKNKTKKPPLLLQHSERLLPKAGTKRKQQCQLNVFRLQPACSGRRAAVVQPKLQTGNMLSRKALQELTCTDQLAALAGNICIFCTQTRPGGPSPRIWGTTYTKQPPRKLCRCDCEEELEGQA